MTSSLGRIAVGTSPLGAGTTRGASDEAAALQTARTLLSCDDVLIDTSNAYAAGRSEEVLGDALAELDAAARRAAASRIVTKVDRDPETGAFDGDRVRRSVEESLTRLGVERMPLLHLHDPYSISLADAFAPNGAVEALIDLREQGIAQSIGIAAGPPPLVQRYVDSGAFDAVLCHNRFTIVDRTAQALFADAGSRGMTVFNAAPFGAGLLAKGAVPGIGYGYRAASDDLLAWTRRLEALCADFDVPLPAAALHFSLRSELIDRTVVGVSSPTRMTELRELCELRISDEFWAELDGLPNAPSPIHDAAYGDDE